MEWIQKKEKIKCGIDERNCIVKGDFAFCIERREGKDKASSELYRTFSLFSFSLCMKDSVDSMYTRIRKERLHAVWKRSERNGDEKNMKDI